MGITEVIAARQSQLLQAAIFAYSRDDLEGAIGFVHSAAAISNPPIILPQPEGKALFSKLYTEKMVAKRDYFFRILNYLCKTEGVNFGKIRAAYANPITIGAIEGPKNHKTRDLDMPSLEGISS